MVDDHEQKLHAGNDAGIHEFAILQEAETFDITPDENPKSDEYAIIGFWRKDKNQRFQCYHFFRIPNPFKRLIREQNGKVMYEVLFPGLNKEIFCFMNIKEDLNEEYKKGYHFC